MAAFPWRCALIADRRDHLDLQVNLLTERHATQIIRMLDHLSTQLGVEQHYDADSRELARCLRPLDSAGVEGHAARAKPPVSSWSTTDLNRGTPKFR